MKTILLILLVMTSNASLSHKLLTDIMKESVEFNGFGFAATDIDTPDEHSVYNLSAAEINSILIKINAQEAIKQFTMHSHQPKAPDPDIQQRVHDYSEFTDKIPHSNEYWTRSYGFQCESGVSQCVEADLESDSLGGHHGGGVFSNVEVGHVRLVAQYVCSHHPIDYLQVLVPYFLGPYSFSHLEFMTEYPFVEVPVISDGHHIEGEYTVDQHIEFKCAFKL